MAVSKKTRFEVFKRDLFQCQYCGRTPPTVVLECDHIHPVCEGGIDEIDNLLTSCFDCNRGKAGRLLTVAPETIAEKTARKREAIEQLVAYNDALREQREFQDAQIEELGYYWFGAQGEENTIFGPSRVPSIRKFLEMLPLQEIKDAMDIALFRKSRSTEQTAFRYFCGVCWRKVRGE